VQVVLLTSVGIREISVTRQLVNEPNGPKSVIEVAYLCLSGLLVISNTSKTRKDGPAVFLISTTARWTSIDCYVTASIGYFVHPDAKLGSAI